MLQERFVAARANDSSGRRSGEIDSFTRGFVRKSARQLVGRYGFKLQDRDDIEQRLYLKLAKRLHTADPDSPKWKAFVAITVRRHITTMIRDRGAKKRDPRRVGSLDVSIGAKDGPMQLAGEVSDHEVPSRRSHVKRTSQELVELLHDAAECLADLTEDKHREFCERLKRDSISQVARDMDIPRTTAHGWVAKLRRQFEERGLRDYL